MPTLPRLDQRPQNSPWFLWTMMIVVIYLITIPVAYYISVVVAMSSYPGAPLIIYLVRVPIIFAIPVLSGLGYQVAKAGHPNKWFFWLLCAPMLVFALLVMSGAYLLLRS